MRIAIDALGIDPPGGGRSATLNLLHGLFRIDSGNEYLVFLDREERSLARAGKNVKCILLRVPNRFAARVWAQIVLPPILRKERIHLVHHVKNLGTFFSPCRSVVTVYDMTTLLFPHLFPYIDVLYWRHIEPLTLRTADRIIAISENTAHDMAVQYSLPREKISVIYPSYDPMFRPIDSEATSEIRHRYDLPSEVVLHVGSISRKKNLLTLVKAFNLLKQEEGFRGKLVLAGRVYKKGYDAELYSYLAESICRADVIFTGPLSTDDLALLYNCARVLVFPSLHEGFGLVPLEAMACGLPVIASPVLAISEVVRDAGLTLRNPKDPSELATAIKRVLSDDGLRRSMIQKGLTRASLFSRERQAQATMQLYGEVVAGNC
jgi:glycosyltransferase involved in cell wall biosynthesis